MPSHTYASHTPSSTGGSLSRYTSLTTPFYQPPPTLTRQSSRGSTDAGSTPVNRKLESPSAAAPQSHSNAQYNNPGSIPAGFMGPSPPGVVPFGRLMQTQHPYAVMGYSPASNPSSNYSSYRHRVSPGTSPLSTPPSTSPGTHLLHYGAGGSGGGGAASKPGGLSRRNSSSKLSALAEERERKVVAVKKGSEESSAKTSSGGFDIITQSCLLGFSEDENEEVLDEESFPHSLNMSFHSNEGEEPGYQSHTHSTTGIIGASGNTLQFVGVDAVHYAPPTSNAAKMRASKPRRAASFSHQRNPQLSEQLAALNTKASSLSAHGDPFDPSHRTSPTLMSSPSAEIVPFKAPFVFSDPSPGSIRPSRRSLGGDRGQKRGEEGEGDGGVCFGALKLREMKDSLVIAEEMHAMAKARQGPILLMSTSADLVRK